MSMVKMNESELAYEVGSIVLETLRLAAEGLLDVLEGDAGQQAYDFLHERAQSLAELYQEEVNNLETKEALEALLGLGGEEDV